MLFQKQGIPVIDRKSAVALVPIVPLTYAGERLLPLSLTDTPDTVPFKPGAAVTSADTLYTDADGFATRAADGTLGAYTALTHPLYGERIFASLTPDGEWLPFLPMSTDHKPATAAAIVAAAKDAGIIDELDGVPLYTKLCAADLVVADATEAGPFAASATALVLQAGESILRGLSLAATAAGCDTYHIAVCPPNEALEKAIRNTIPATWLFVSPPLYPAAVAPAGGTPLRIGVQALIALAAAVDTDIAPQYAVVTVTGDAVEKPANLLAPLGTPLSELLKACNAAQNPATVLLGDAIRGIPLTDTAMPLVTGITCMVVSHDTITDEETPCIGCGRCAEVCHRGLLPYEIDRRHENMHYERLQKLHPELCDGCAACDCVCPAGRHLADRVQLASKEDTLTFFSVGGDSDG